VRPLRLKSSIQKTALTASVATLIGIVTSALGVSAAVSHHQSRDLFSHTSPDGSKVVARLTTCKTVAGLPHCGSVKGGSPSTEFIVTIGRSHYRLAVLDSYRESICSESGAINPMFGSSEARNLGPAPGLILLCANPTVAVVRLAASGPGGASPKGDHMTPVDGWIAFPVRNVKNLHSPQAYGATGKLLGSSLPFPCC
jgi:hypothetical protein